MSVNNSLLEISETLTRFNFKTPGRRAKNITIRNKRCCCSVAKSCVTLATPWSVARQALLSMGFLRQEYSGLPVPFPEILPIQGTTLHWQAGSLPLSHQGSPKQGLEKSNCAASPLVSPSGCPPASPPASPPGCRQERPLGRRSGSGGEHLPHYHPKRRCRRPAHYLQGSASRPDEAHRRPVDDIRPPPLGPGGAAWAPA